MAHFVTESRKNIRQPRLSVVSQDGRPENGSEQKSPQQLLDNKELFEIVFQSNPICFLRQLVVILTSTVPKLDVESGHSDPMGVT